MMFSNVGLQVWLMSFHDKKHKPDTEIEKSESRVSAHIKDLFCGHKNVLHKFHHERKSKHQEFSRRSPFRQAFRESNQTISRHIASIVRSECGKIAQFLMEQEQREDGKQLIWEILACSFARLHGQAKDDYFLRSQLRPSDGYLKEIGLAVKSVGIPCKECGEDIWVPQREGELCHIYQRLCIAYIKIKGYLRSTKRTFVVKGKNILLRM